MDDTGNPYGPGYAAGLLSLPCPPFYQPHVVVVLRVHLSRPLEPRWACTGTPYLHEPGNSSLEHRVQYDPAQSSARLLVSIQARRTCTASPHRARWLNRSRRVAGVRGYSRRTLSSPTARPLRKQCQHSKACRNFHCALRSRRHSGRLTQRGWREAGVRTATWQGWAVACSLSPTHRGG